LVSVSSSPRPHDQLEIAVLAAANRAVSNTDQPRKAKKADLKTPQPPTTSKELKTVEEPSTDTPDSKTTDRPKNSFDLKHWPAVINDVKSQKASLYTALRLAQPQLTDNTLTLFFPFAFHQRKINQAEHHKLVEDLINARSAQAIKLVCTVDKSLAQSLAEEVVTSEAEGPADGLQAISNIFGPAEMLES